MRDLSVYYENIEPVDFFNQLPEEVQNDLIEWYNVKKLDFTDKQRLVRLYNKGCFEAWNCPQCKKTRVFNGDVDRAEMSLEHFQGILNQNWSYFGSKEKYTEAYLEAMCDNCRCHSH